MARPRRSTVANDLDVRQPISEVVQTTEEAIEAEEQALLKRLSKKYHAKEHGERIPGKTVDGSKTIWTYVDMVARFPIVSFVPDETIPLSWNGVKVQAYAGIEMHVPKPFHDLYLRHKRELLPKRAPPGIEVLLGAGGLKEE